MSSCSCLAQGFLPAAHHASCLDTNQAHMPLSLFYKKHDISDSWLRKRIINYYFSKKTAKEYTHTYICMHIKHNVSRELTDQLEGAGIQDHSSWKQSMIHSFLHFPSPLLAFCFFFQFLFLNHMQWVSGHMWRLFMHEKQYDFWTARVAHTSTLKLKIYCYKI